MRTLLLLCSLWVTAVSAVPELIDPNAKPSQAQCVQTASSRCIETICRHVGSPNCHQQCKEHAMAKCKQGYKSSKEKQQAKTLDVYTSTASKLNQCIELCRHSSNRGCAHQCRKNAKAAVRR